MPEIPSHRQYFFTRLFLRKEGWFCCFSFLIGIIATWACFELIFGPNANTQVIGILVGIVAFYGYVFFIIDLNYINYNCREDRALLMRMREMDRQTKQYSDTLAKEAEEAIENRRANGTGFFW